MTDFRDEVMRVMRVDLKNDEGAAPLLTCDDEGDEGDEGLSLYVHVRAHTHTPTHAHAETSLESTLIGSSPSSPHLYDISPHNAGGAAPEPKNKGGRPRKPEEHGTERGYQQHRYNGTPYCAACREAHTRHNNPEAKQRRRA